MPWPAARDVPVPTGRSVLLGVRGVLTPTAQGLSSVQS